MMHTSTRLLAAVVLSRPVQAQTGPNLVVTMHHTGNFTVGVRGIYTIVVSNTGGTASSGRIDVNVSQPTGSFTYVSQVGAGWSCFFNIAHFGSMDFLSYATDGVIAPGGSAPPITWIVVPRIAGTITNTLGSITDLTIVLPAVPTLPQWALIALTVCLALAGVMALRRRPT